MRKLLTLVTSAVALTIAGAGFATAQETPAPVRPLTPDSPGAGAIKKDESLEKEDPAMERRRSTVPRSDKPGASDTPPDRSYGETGSTQEGARVSGGLSVQQIVGASVHNAAGEAIGEVEDLVIGPENEVTIAIVQVGGFLGIGSKTVAVEMRELDQSPKGSGFITTLTKEQLATLPTYRKESGSWVRSAD